LDLFLTQELLSWPQPDISAELSKIPEFGTDVKNQYWIDIHKRVIEHVNLSFMFHCLMLLQNIRVLEAYYSKMTMKRASQLLGLPEAVCEAIVFVINFCLGCREVYFRDGCFKSNLC
jgi:hypothetical protein